MGSPGWCSIPWQDYWGTVVGPRAGEILAEITLAVRHGLRATDLAASTHPYPTYCDGVAKAAISVVQKRLAAPAVHFAMTVLVVLRRAWASRPVRRSSR